MNGVINWFTLNNIRLDGVQEVPGQKAWSDSPKINVDLFIDDRSFGAPLVKPIGFNSPVIDWGVVLDKFRKSDASGLSFTNAINNLFRH